MNQPFGASKRVLVRAQSVLMALLCVVAVSSQANAATYVLGGLVGAITGSAEYGWDGSENALFRAALQNASFFGPSGTVTTSINTVNISSTANLTGINGLVVPWWFNSSATVAQVNQVIAFLQAGGDLLVSQDDPANAPVGNALGIVTNQVGGETWTPTGYFASGPFGALGANSVTAYFDVSYFSPVAGATAGSTDANGATTLYWTKHVFCPTCGAMIITGDTDTWATGATFSPLNADGIFSLDLAAFLVQNTGGFTGAAGPATTPAPASLWLALMGLVAAGLFVVWRSRYAAR
jgi:hypothetical protein